MTESATVRRDCLNDLLPFQRQDFTGLFRAMDGYPVIIRLIDPPLHEFLPGHEDLMQRLTDQKIRLLGAKNLQEVDDLLQKIEKEAYVLGRVEAIHESNPMLGTRGVRLSITMPELTQMQVRAIFEAACQVVKEGIDVKPEVMIPLACHVNELKVKRTELEKVAKEIMQEQGIDIDYKFGTMIELPRAALTADEIAEYAEFFSFGTNDLTQTVFGISRDDAEKGFLAQYIQKGILPENPFESIDAKGLAKLMGIGVDLGRKTRP